MSLNPIYTGRVDLQPLPPVASSPLEIAVERALLSTLRAQIRTISKDLPPDHYVQLRRFLEYSSATLSNYITALDRAQEN